MTTATPNPIGSPPRPAGEFDVPLADVERDVWLAEQSARTEWLVSHPQQAEQEHVVDPVDTNWSRLACAHPEKCSTPDDYAGWTPGGTK